MDRIDLKGYTIALLEHAKSHSAVSDAHVTALIGIGYAILCLTETIQQVVGDSGRGYKFVRTKGEK